MSDLISRQAAIDAIADYLSKTTYTSAISFLNVGALILARVPSAQPDTDSRIEQAIRVLQKNYNLALSRDYIRNPIAWALYETWKEFDR